MRLHDSCLTLRSFVRDLQDMEPAYKKHGEAFPEFINDWSGAVFSILYTRGGRLMAPSAQELKPGLRTRFMDAMEGRMCRINYQQTVDCLENILDEAVLKQDYMDLAKLLSRNMYVPVYGDRIVDKLQAGGLKIRDVPRLQNIMLAAYDIGRRPEPPRPA